MDNNVKWLQENDILLEKERERRERRKREYLRQRDAEYARWAKENGIDHTAKSIKLPDGRVITWKGQGITGGCLTPKKPYNNQ